LIITSDEEYRKGHHNKAEKEFLHLETSTLQKWIDETIENKSLCLKYQNNDVLQDLISHESLIS